MTIPGDASFTSRLSEAEAALAKGWSLPYAWMGNAALHDLEVKSIFERSWQIAGLERRVAGPGAQMVVQVGQVPVVVVRGNDGALRGFVNVCRHRGYPVAVGDGCSKLLMCRYHAWTYDLEGRLRRAPGAEDTEGFDFAELSLRPVAVEAWRGIVFINADPDARQLHEAHPDLERVAAKAEFDLRPYTPFRSDELEIRSDWKLVYDNAVECYHCPSMHGKTLELLYESNGFETALWDGGMRYANSNLKEGNGLHRGFQLFPGAMMLMDPVIGLLLQFAPSTPGVTRMVVNYLAAPGADANDVARFVDLWSQTLQEDKDICQLQGRGIAAGRVERGRLIPSREDSLPGVQALILSAYRNAVTPGEHGHAA